MTSAIQLVVHQHLAIGNIKTTTRPNGEVELRWDVALVHPHA